jgi:hypothetical protein
MEEHYTIHVVILSAVSPHFKALCTNSLKEGEPEINEVYLDIPGHMLDLILDYMSVSCVHIKSKAPSFRGEIQAGKLTS